VLVDFIEYQRDRLPEVLIVDDIGEKKGITDVLPSNGRVIPIEVGVFLRGGRQPILGKGGFPDLARAGEEYHLPGRHFGIEKIVF
jgi:hypothetical protein